MVVHWENITIWNTRRGEMRGTDKEERNENGRRKSMKEDNKRAYRRDEKDVKI